MGGGTTTTTQEHEMPAIQQEAIANQLWSSRLARAMPFTPYMGPTVAALAPAELAGMEATNALANAFGMPHAAGPVEASMPQAQDFGGGVQGYSPYESFNQMLGMWNELYPGAAQYLAGMTLPAQETIPNEYYNQLLNPRKGRRRKRRKGSS